MNTIEKKIVFFIFLSVQSLFLRAQDIRLDWVGIFKGNINEARATDINQNNEIAVVGSLIGTVDFNPGIGVNNLTNPGGSVASYVCKLDSNGNYMWAQRFVGPDGSFDAYDVKYDSNGNIIICGSFFGTLDFDNSNGVLNLTSSGSYDAVVLKLDANGNFLWAKFIGSASYEYFKGLILDFSSNIYVTGTFSGVVDFDPNSGIENRTANGDAAFVLKLNPSGNFVFVSCIIGDGSQNMFWNINDIEITSVGQLVVTGKFNGVADFDPGLSANYLSSSTISDSWGNQTFNHDIFIWNIDLNGDFVWVKQIEAASITAINELLIDQNDNIYGIGSITDTTDLDPSNSIFIANVSSQQDFLLRLTPNGDFIDAFLIPSEMSCQAVLDSQNNLYISGAYQNTQPEFVIGSDTITLNSIDDLDVFLLKKDSNMDNLWVKSFGGIGQQQVSNLYIDLFGNLLMSAALIGKMDFDPSSGVYLDSSSTWNSYVAKYNPCISSQLTINAVTCYNYVLNGLTYTSSGQYTQLLQNAAGCDSTITLNLTIKNSSTSSITEVACNSFTAPDGQVFTQTGLYTSVIPNSVQCDSIITVNLTIVPTDAPEICMVSVDSAGINNVIYWDKTVYPSADTFYVYREIQNNNYQIIGTLPFSANSQFVDTVRALYFPNTGDPKISSSRYKLAFRDTCGNLSSLGRYHRTMFLQDQMNGNFNWNHYEIENETSPVAALTTYYFLRDNNLDGIFESVIGSTTSNLATDPSYSTFQNTADWRIETSWSIQCEGTKKLTEKSLLTTSKSNRRNYQANGLEENIANQLGIRCYPNVVTQTLYVLCSNPSLEGDLALLDLFGKVVLEQNLSGDTQVDVSNLAKGTYFLKIESNGRVYSQKLIKN